MSDLSTRDNKLLQGLNNTVMKDEWMQGMLTSSRAEQQKQLKALFTRISDNDVTASEKQALTTKAEKIAADLEEMQKQMDELEALLDANAEIIQNYTNDIVELVSAAEQKSEELEEKQKTIVKTAIEDVFYQYRRGIIGKDAITPEIRKRVQNSTYKDTTQGEIRNIIGRLDAKQAEVADLANKATGWLNQRNSIENQYYVVKTTYTLLNKTLTQIGNTNGGYTNRDTDTNIPVYSLDKTAYVSNLFKNNNFNVQSTNTNFGTAKTTTTDRTNVQTHEETSGNTIQTIRTGQERTFTTDTTTKDAGNTISSNAQLKALAINYSGIIDGMSQNGFTFKEAMYALFDKDMGLFKNSGITYDLSKQAGGANYQIQSPGDAETMQMYTDLAAKIKSVYGVDANFDMSGVSTKDIREVISTRQIVVNTDPLTFQKDGKEYAFVLDRDASGTFSGAEEFLGGKQGTSWFDDLKSLDLDGDGKLTGDELKNVKLLSSKFSESGDKHTSTTDIAYELTNAKNLGIEEIDLAGLENNVNKSTGEIDINKNQIFNDSFNFKINGQTYTAKRTDDSQHYINAVYSGAFEKSFEIGFTEDQVNEVLDGVSQEAIDFASKFETEIMNINTIANATQIAKETEIMFEKVANRVQADENSQLQRAANKAAALSEAASWSGLKDNVKKIADQRGINIDMEQAKGIYMQNGSLSAAQVVDKYQEMLQQEQDSENEAKIEQTTWNAIILCLKNNIEVRTNEILDMVRSGKAETAEDVVKILQEKNEKDASNDDEKK